jgi:hypothetical protein
MVPPWPTSPSNIADVKLRIVAIAAALFVLVTACADVTGSAIEVNGQSIDRSEVMDLIADVNDEVRDLEGIPDEFRTSQGVASSQVSTQVLTVLVQNEFLRQALAERSLDVTEAEIEQAVPAPDQGSGSATFDQLVAEVNARVDAVEAAQIDTDALVAALEVEVDPRFGRWDPVVAEVVPNPVDSSS